MFLSAEAAEVLRAFLRKMATLTAREMFVLSRRMEAATSTDGRPMMAEIGAELGISKQAVKYAMGSIAGKVPELLALFPGMRQTIRPEQRRRTAKAVARATGPRQMFLGLDFGGTAKRTTDEGNGEGK